MYLNRDIIMAYGSSFRQLIYYNSPLFVKNLISSSYGWLEKRKRYGKYYTQYFQSLSERQWLSNKELEEIQFQKTKAFLINANNHSNFYNNLLKNSGFFHLLCKIS